MKKIIIFLITLFVLMPNTLVNASSYKNNMYYVTHNDYDIKFLVFNPKIDSNIMYSELPLKNYRIIPSMSYGGKAVTGDVYWENPDYVIIEGYQSVNIIFDCVENNETVILQVDIYGEKTKDTLINEQNSNVIEIIDNLDSVKKEENTIEKLKLYGGFKYPDKRYNGIVGCSINDIFTQDDFIFKDKNDNIVNGYVTFENFDNTKVGIQEIKWIFIPYDTRYEIQEGYREINLIEIEDYDMEEPTIPSLTATTILLSNSTSYDINLNNKISGSKYYWSSSNTEIVEVNHKNGLIKAISEGTAIITCEIILPDGNIQILESLVTVGYDENAPILTDDDIELELGDKYTIGVENLIQGSKVSWKTNDKNIVKVSTKGKITTVGVGQTYITCTITTPDKQVIVLKCNVTVTEKEI